MTGFFGGFAFCAFLFLLAGAIIANHLTKGD